jgi:leucyl aminopeptidase
MKKTTLTALTLFCLTTHGHIPDFNQEQLSPIYADLNIMRAAGVPILFSDEKSEIGYSVVNGSMLQRISEVAHKNGRCGNFEVLPEIPQDLKSVENEFNKINSQIARYKSYEILSKNSLEPLLQNDKIFSALQKLSSTKIRESVEWLSSYPTRFNRSPEANRHVVDLEKKLNALVSTASFPVSVDLITHRNTPQKTVRVSIKGSERPNEIIAMGAHLDSIVGWGGNGLAPGADDNASGSSSLIEALRILIEQEQPKRSLDFFWYAGEESGLLGSAEIAEAYKNEKKQVIAVLQLDMTLFPGDGEFRITSMTDFTSPWLRDYLKSMNTTYLNVEILEDKCGYGCSDHASWNRRGFPTLFPTEAKFNSSFKNIHTVRDVITPEMSFEHALVFSKIALIMGMDLANSSNKEVFF